MNNITPLNTDREDALTKKIAYAVYVMYLVCVILPVLPILPIIGVVFAYIFENDAKDILKSHFQLQIRSFWIGILYFGISIVLIPVIIGIPMVGICIIWWVIRNVKGLKSLVRNEAIAKPKTWLF
jgi:uncharacterized membrane protein